MTHIRSRLTHTPDTVGWLLCCSNTDASPDTDAACAAFGSPAGLASCFTGRQRDGQSRHFAHEGFQCDGLLRRARHREQLAEPLRPGRRGRGRCNSKFLVAILFGEFGKRRRHLAQSAGMTVIADKMKRRRFRSRAAQ